MLWNSVGSLTYLGFQWLITVLVVRMSNDYSAAGSLALAMSIYNIFAPLAVYRMFTYQISDVQRENSTGEYLAFRIMTSLLALVGCAVYTAVTSPEAVIPVLFYALFKLISLIIDVFHGADQLHGRMDYIGKSLMLQGLCSFLAFVVIFNMTSALEASLLGMAASTAIIGVLFDLPRTRRFGEIRVGISRHKSLHLFKYCAPIVIAAVASAAAPAIPRQYLELVAGEHALGIYASVAAPVAIIQMGASYIYSPLLTTFTQLFVAKSRQALSRLFLKVTAGIAALGLLLSGAFLLVGEWLLNAMFGSSILPNTYLLLPIIGTTIVSAYVWFLSDLLVSFRAFRGTVIGNFTAVLLAIPLSYFFVGKSGMNGVSFTGIVSYGLASMVMFGFVIALIRNLKD